jgi:hypothetical protein
MNNPAFGGGKIFLCFVLEVESFFYESLAYSLKSNYCTKMGFMSLFEEL